MTITPPSYTPAHTNKSSLPVKPIVRYVRAGLIFLFTSTAIINLIAATIGNTSLLWTHLTASLLAAYLLLETLLLLRNGDTFGLLSPALLSIVFHFWVSYLFGITVAAVYPDVMTRFAYWLPDIDSALSDTLLMSGLAAFCMLRGYGLGRPLAQRLRRVIQRQPMIRRDLRTNVKLLFIIQVFCIALVSYAIEIGLYGLLSSSESIERYVNVIEFLNIALAAGTLSYFLILVRYYNRRAHGYFSSIESLTVTGLIAIQVIIGLLTAYKTQVVFPFVIAGFAYFLATRQFPMRFAMMTIAALVAAYAVVEPFRAGLGAQGQFPSSFTEAVTALESSLDMNRQAQYVRQGSRVAEIAERSDLSGMSALAIGYADSGQLQTSIRNELRDSILLAPFLAYIPRVIWPEKPGYSGIGTWFNQNVRGEWSDDRTSVAMGPIGYLYMTSGIVAVILGFFGFGLMQALLFQGVARAGAGGLIIYMSVAGALVTIPSAFGPGVTGILRMLPIAFVAQWVLLRPTISRTSIRTSPTSSNKQLN